jgi:tetratricopeptide (TPR) repeat protein
MALQDDVQLISGEVQSSHRKWRAMLWTAALALLVFVTYLPAFNAGFIWDDDDYILRNDTLRSVDGLRRIWLELGAVPQYYPLVHTTFWIEHKIWGVDPTGYHVVNISLHALASILLWLALRRLGLPSAASWVAAAVFAVHPVHVESVAWVTERKNVLSAVLYLLALLAYVKFDSLNASERRWQYYGLTIIAFVGALFSKTVTCSLPAAILLLTWWKRGRNRLVELALMMPLFVLGLAAGVTTAWMERHHVGASGSEWDFSLVERFLIAGRNVWFYAGKLLWPTNLAFIYPRWSIDASQWTQYVYPIAAAAVVVVLWLLQKRVGRGPLVAVLFFGGTLLPALGFVNVYPFRFSFVADHFQYLASIGLIVLIVMAAWRGVSALTGPAPAAALAAVVITTLATLSFHQSRIYHNIETLWRDTVAKNPTAYMPVYNLARELELQGRDDEAMTFYRRALDNNLEGLEAMNNLGILLAKSGDEEAGMELFQRALSINPEFPDALNSMGAAYARQGKIDQAIEQFSKVIAMVEEQGQRVNPNILNDARVNLGVAFVRQGRLDEAVVAFSRACQDIPRDIKARYNLALTLNRQGKHGEAIAQFKEALALAPNNADIHNKLAQTYMVRSQFDKAIEHYQRAVAIAPQFIEARNNLAVLLIQSNRPEEAVGHFQAILDLRPNDPNAQIALAQSLLAANDPKVRDVPRAIMLAEQACQSTGRRDPHMLDVLAEAHARAQEWNLAAMAAQRAANQARLAGEESLAQQLEARAREYESHLAPSQDRPRE